MDFYQQQEMKRKKSRIKVDAVANHFKLYIDGLIHLSFKQGDLIGFQSWMNATNWYSIEYTFKNGSTIISDYTSCDLWKEILIKLDEFKF